MKRQLLIFLLLISFVGALFALDVNNSCEGGNICTINLTSASPQIYSTSSSMLYRKNTDVTNLVLTHQTPTGNIQLQSNPTTGYSWAVQPYDQKLLIVTNAYKVGEPKLIGSGGIETWTIQATPLAFKNAPQEITLTFLYRRSWEKGVPPVQTKVVTVKVQ